MVGNFNFEFINDQLDWSGSAKKFLDIEDLVLNPEQDQVFSLIYTNTSAQLSDDHFRFMPLLPSDSVEIYRRTEELGCWSSGFLHGLGQILGGRGEDKLPSEVADAMRDIANISQVVVGEDDDVEENEVYWNELVEYIKVAALTIYNEFKQKPSDSTVH